MYYYQYYQYLNTLKLRIISNYYS